MFINILHQYEFQIRTKIFHSYLVADDVGGTGTPNSRCSHTQRGVSVTRIMSLYRFSPDDPTANPRRSIIRLGCRQEENGKRCMDQCAGYQRLVMTGDVVLFLWLQPQQPSNDDSQSDRNDVQPCI